MRKFIIISIIAVLLMVSTACSKSSKIDENVINSDWDSITKSAKGTTVNFYGWGGDDRINKWIDNYVAKELKEKYDINLKRVPMNIDDILNKLLGEKQAGSKSGTIDIVWINGENFYTAKNAGLLYGPFTEKLPNFNKYIDKNSDEVKYDFGFSVDGYEAPYGKAQLVMIYDENKIQYIPKNHQELLEMVKKYPGKFTYPAPPDFTGSAFVRNIIYDVVGYEKVASLKADKETVRKAIEPAMDFLREIKPYLWNKGRTYPATVAQLDNMYSDNEVIMTLSYNPFSVPGKIISGQFPDSTKSFVFDKGTIGNTHFLAIPYNAPNKAGAFVAINFILGVDAQVSKYNPENWGDLPVLDYNKLSTEEKIKFENTKIGNGTFPVEELLRHRVPELPANLVPIIEEIWQENIPEGE